MYIYIYIFFRGPEQKKSRSSVDISKDWYGPLSTKMWEVIVYVRVRGVIQRGRTLRSSVGSKNRFVCVGSVSGTWTKAFISPVRNYNGNNISPVRVTIWEFIVKVRVRRLIQKGKTMVTPIDCQHAPCVCVSKVAICLFTHTSLPSWMQVP